MKNRFFQINLFLGILIFTNTGFAQTQKLDSLLTVWNDKSLSDSIRVASFSDYIYQGYYSKPDSAITLADSLFEYSESINYDYGKAKAAYLIGTASFIKGDFLNALKYISLSDQLRKMPHAGTYTLLGFIYVAIDDTSKGLDYFNLALKTHKNLNERRWLSNAYSNIAIIQREIGQLDSAMFYLNKSLALCDEFNDIVTKSRVVGNIASVHLKKKEYQKAIEVADESILLFDSYNKFHSSFSYVIKGLSYLETGKSELAISNCSTAINYARSAQQFNEESEACNCLYKAFKVAKNWKMATYTLEELRKLEKSIEIERLNKKTVEITFKNQIREDSLEQVAQRAILAKKHQEEIRAKNNLRNLSLAIGGVFLLIALIVYGRLHITRKAKAEVEKEKKRSDNLLLNILPAEVAEELKQTGESQAQQFDQVSILFTDFKEFTQTAEKLSAKELVNEINTCFKAFDNICEKYGIEKIKTIGDSYMCASGLKSKDSGLSRTGGTDIGHWTQDIVLAALEMQEFMSTYNSKLNTHNFSMRAGIHSGPVVAGIVGIKKFQYDIWGDTVNTASRMESHGEVGKVNISEATYETLKNDSSFTFEDRGKIDAKGKGEVKMFFISKNSNV
ncbi:MAG: tetratricopeptide repeat protein [Bacteroidia bacterium]